MADHIYSNVVGLSSDRNGVVVGLSSDRNGVQDKYLNKMAFARDNGCNTLLLTSKGEPMSNRGFIKWVCELNTKLQKPFRWVELQTSGLNCDMDNLRDLKRLGVISTVALSVAYIFDEYLNARIMHKATGYVSRKVANDIKACGFNLRLSLNIWNQYETLHHSALRILSEADAWAADQVTLRRLYKSNYSMTKQSAWVTQNDVTDTYWESLKDQIRKEGIPLNTLDFGATRYSMFNRISTVVDNDCMSGDAKPEIRYLVLQPDLHLYTHWNNPGSKLF